MVLLVVAGAAVAPAKAIYLPVVLLCLAIPARNLDPRKAPASPTVTLRGISCYPGRFVQLGVLLLAAVLWTAVNLSALVYAARDMNRMLLAAAALAGVVLLVVIGWLYSRVRNNPARLRWFKGGLAALVVCGAVGGVYLLSHMGGGLTPDQLLQIQPNGDSVWTFSFGLSAAICPQP